MKLWTAIPAALSLLSFATASSVRLPSTFKPPQVFKNVNLVHVISLEKIYAKEQVNVLIENIASTPQDEYFFPFTVDELSRVGGFEVKDRKNEDAGTFTVEAVEFDPKSDLQYYRIRLPTPLKAGGQQTLGITYNILKAVRPLPAQVAQDGSQFLAYRFSAYCPSAYVTSKQKTEVKFSSSNVPDYTKLPSVDGDKPNPAKQGSKLTYGPFDEKPAGAVEPVQVRFEFTKPVTHIARLERDIEVSHWGGNVAFEERYTLFNMGANLSSQFSRVKWATQSYHNSPTHALKEIKFPLRVGSADVYYYDVIGNVSTSRFRSNKREALLEVKPRYPIFGGWKFPFTIGWNAEAKKFVRRTSEGQYVLNVPFLEGPKQPEGIEYSQVQLRLLLPEGATNVKYHTKTPSSSITSVEIGTQKTYLDTIGRTSLVITAHNLIDEHRDRELIVSYDYSLTASLRKPLVIFTSLMGVFALVWAAGRVETNFSYKK
ncbi:hypothetical protein PspLS_05542 [Pyricularia sp. CBS 133598]|nr:hypothetical protein PspLS_05542 [Pyricularia sp. CBS 133598]